MKPEVLKDVVEKTKALIASPTCCKEARAAAILEKKEDMLA